MPYTRNSLQAQWLTSHNGLVAAAIDWSSDFGFFLSQDIKDGSKTTKGKLTTNQLRRFFGDIKRLEMQVLSQETFDERLKNELLLLKPKLAYAKGRSQNTKIDEFHQEITTAIDAVIGTPTKESFRNFVKLVEAIVAYHKAHGGE